MLSLLGCTFSCIEWGRIVNRQQQKMTPADGAGVPSKRKWTTPEVILAEIEDTDAKGLPTPEPTRSAGHSS
jgi:hypothetical protein